MRTSVFTFSDGYSIPYYEWTSGKKSGTVVLGIHGITPDLDQWGKLASNLVAGMAVEVHIPVLRGYKPNQKRKGHLSVMEQYDTDLKELIEELEQEYDRVIVVGHSAGCGNVLRGLFYQDLSAKALLLAPFIHPEMKVFKSKEKSQKDANSGYELYQGRAMFAHILSKMGVKVAESCSVVQVPLREKPLLKDSPVIHFRLSYRMMMGRFLAPDLASRFIEDQNIPIIIGDQDEVIDAEKLADLLSNSAKDNVHRIEGVNHNDLFDNPDSLSRIMTEILHLSEQEN